MNTLRIWHPTRFEATKIGTISETKTQDNKIITMAHFVESVHFPYTVGLDEKINISPGFKNVTLKF